ncbi:LOW QUALITY PROTEIN: mannose/glucose-specific lectin Cramoll-like [Abrus precatorius]|uniref:LOW QUALITY PROTEIN: mannose/glucose-specific lectin Cramoll-like n=1 Tax=Abrus precatorius TaxID=3816 RepID=A0A8B8MAS6_ABRPR|nr:LOW QUALITY PROTEIN: mannose/glucose-specific lectin Cramoll-like [Abrus precatorius]
MAISNKPHSIIPLLAFTTMFLMLLNTVHSANSLSFTFDQFVPNPQDLILQGDAKTTKVLELTKLDASGGPVSDSVGRALYYAPVHLWDSSAVEASFRTTFTFTISSTNPGDGLAFFIAPVDTSIPPNSHGKLLGLFPNTNVLKNSTSYNKVDFKASSNQVVAVEFDSYVNLNPDIGDPNYKHIGIDVNSIRSKTTARWNWQNGKVATAHISYNSVAKRLSVVTTYPGSAPVELSHEIELNTVLPDWVRVGLSASTGQAKESNTVLSWSFTSGLVLGDTVQNEENMLIASVV